MVHLQRHYRVPLPQHRTAQLIYLPAMQQQLPRPLRLVVVSVAARMLGDVGPQQPQLPAFRPGERVPQVHPASPDRLDLGASQDQPRLKAILNMIVVIGLAVDRNRLQRHGHYTTSDIVMSSRHCALTAVTHGC